MKFSLLKIINSNKLIVVASVLLCLFLASMYFLYGQNSETATADSPNVILISVDTLRADHLGAYGYTRDTSPNIDNLAKVSTVFENAFTPVPCTAPSYASLFTGLEPSTHNSFSAPLDKKFITLAESLGRSQYNTAGIVSTGMLANKVGNLGRGFDSYSEVDKNDTRAGRDNTYGTNGDNTALQRGKRTTEEAINWLNKNEKNKFFLFVQYADPHLPYGEEAPFTDKYVQGDKNNPLSSPDVQQDTMDSGHANSPEDYSYLMDKYDENISYADYYIGKLLDEIKSQGLYDNSIIILTADHGESFDHNNLGHCWRLYESTIKVPVIIHDPKFTPRKVKENVSLIDIYPTLSARLGLKPNSYNFDGVDLSKTYSGVSLGRENLYSITDPSHKEGIEIGQSGLSFRGQLYLQLSDTKRVIYNQNSGKVEAYDISKDPDEQENIYPNAARESYEKLILWIDKHPLNDTQIRLNDSRYKALQGLGYL